MSMPLAIGNSGADAQAPSRALSVGRLRTALLRIALVGLVATAGLPGHPGGCRLGAGDKKRSRRG